jgi:hypothetical protein
MARISADNQTEERRMTLSCKICHLILWPLVRVFGPGPILLACSKCIPPEDMAAERHFYDEGWL